MKTIPNIKPYRFITLSRFDLSNELISKLHYKKEYIEKNILTYHYILSEIIIAYNKDFLSGKEANDFVRFYSTSVYNTTPYSTLKSQTKSTNNYSDFIKDLENIGLIIYGKKFNSDTKTNVTYVKICNEILKGNDLVEFQPCYKKTTQDKLKNLSVRIYNEKQRKIEKYKSITYDENRPLHRIEIEQQTREKIKIDSRKANKLVESLYNDGDLNIHQLICYQRSIETVNKFTYYKDESSSRIYTPFSSLPSILRKFIHYKKGNKKYYLNSEADIASAQFLMLVQLIKSIDVNVLNTVSSKFFIELIEEKSLYNYIQRVAFIKKKKIKGVDNIKQLKTNLISEVLYSNDRNFISKIEQLFKEEFPDIFDFIVKFKKTYSNKILAKKLQQIEAEFIIDKICPVLLINNITFLTIHDAIFVNDNELDFLTHTMAEEFEKEKLHPKFHIKNVS